ncbi:MAG: adenosylcobinamide-GDP ribazoletransferase [Magnetococcales bacterium]|nr:adenosylcobinamide-GDP ribazoletransferase [Magnetococcales bacterium]
MWRPLLIALGLLTRIPIPWRGALATPRELGWSVLFYPAVGVCIGALLMALALGMPAGLDGGVRAALVVIAWTWLTGGLHLEGLADSADGWVGGLGNATRGLEIMRDPRSGPAALMAVTLLLLLKWNLARAAIETNATAIWLVAPTLGRLGIVLLLATTPYVRAGGMGETAAQELPRGWAFALVVGVLLGVGWFGSWWVVGVAGAVWLILRRAWMRRFGGVTGDLAGATCELVETITMLAWIG